jgi:hypothetical protein
MLDDGEAERLERQVADVATLLAEALPQAEERP